MFLDVFPLNHTHGSQTLTMWETRGVLESYPRRADPFLCRKHVGFWSHLNEEAESCGFHLARRSFVVVGRRPGMVFGCLLRVRGLPSGIDSEMVLSSVSRCRKGMILICFLWIRKRLTI